MNLENLLSEVVPTLYKLYEIPYEVMPVFQNRPSGCSNRYERRETVKKNSGGKDYSIKKNSPMYKPSKK